MSEVTLFEARDGEKSNCRDDPTEVIACPMDPDITHIGRTVLKNGDWEKDEELLNEIGRPVEKASLDSPAATGRNTGEPKHKTCGSRR